MPSVARVNDKVDNLHGCDPMSFLQGTEKSSTIEVNNQKVSLEGDGFTPHTTGTPPICVSCPPAPFTATYSSKVEWEGKKCLAVGDLASNHKISAGSANVVVGS